MAPIPKVSSLQGLKPGSLKYFKVQNSLIFDRPLLKLCYDFWYDHLLKDAATAPPQGIILEVGSGGSYLKQLEPVVVTSHVV